MGSSDRIRIVRVERIATLGPAMTRVTIRVVDGGMQEDVRVHAGHCRLLFPDAEDPTRTWARVFTYRRWHADGSFDIDFVRHQGAGPAARWIACAETGDVIGWKHGGPPKITLEDPPRHKMLIYGDASALPVISALLERAHPDLAGDVFLDLPPGIDPWVPEAPRALNMRVIRTSRDRDPEDILRGYGQGRWSRAFIACEAGTMRSLRRYALDDLGLLHTHITASGYWKIGLTSEQVEREKRTSDWFGDTPLESEHSASA